MKPNDVAEAEDLKSSQPIPNNSSTWLSQLPRYLAPPEVSRITGRKEGTLANDRSAGIGIKFCRVGRSIRYDLADVIAYMDQHKVKTRDSE